MTALASAAPASPGLETVTDGSGCTKSGLIVSTTRPSTITDRIDVEGLGTESATVRAFLYGPFSNRSGSDALRERIIAQERPDSVLPTMGGQTALNLAKALAKRGEFADACEHYEQAIAVVTEEVPSYRFVDLDVALAEIQERDERAQLLGIGPLPPYEPLQLLYNNTAVVIGIGVDFTSCTMLPCKGDGTPHFRRRHRADPRSGS